MKPNKQVVLSNLTLKVALIEIKNDWTIHFGFGLSKEIKISSLSVRGPHWRGPQA